jgi:hypothetical protein
MRTSSAASLLVTALVMLRRPCARNKATAQLLLKRAAEHSELTPAEREACLDLADDLDCDHPDSGALHMKPAVSMRPATIEGPERRLSLVSALPLAHDTKGSIA